MGEVRLVGDERAPDEGTLAQVHGGGHLWWIRARAWQGRQWFWGFYVVDLGEMDTGKCREGGQDGVDWPPGRPEQSGLLKSFSLLFFVTFFQGRKQAFWGSLFSSWVRL